MFVAFEGIDGSGKTTLSNLVCQALRERGVDVVHAREAGVLATAVARRIREVTRDPALLEMDPWAETFLNLAREAQQLEQIVRPALALGRTCIADRSLHSLVALAVAGRGLPPGEVVAAARIAARGTQPELVVLVDVEPGVARLRKRAAKILDGRTRDASSRKGLAGAGLQVRIREHLLAEARADPGRWRVVSNRGRPLQELAAEITAEILRRRGEAVPEGTALPARRPRAPSREAARSDSPRRIAARFMEEVLALAGPEPALAAQLVASIPGAREHALRVELARRVPRVVARGLAGLADAASARLRRELVAAAPADVAASLEWDLSPEAMDLREALLERAPAEVAASLSGIASPEAWVLRERALLRGALAGVVEGLASLDDPRAFDLRFEAMRRGLWPSAGRSLSGVSSPQADVLRAALAERDALAALRAIHGVDGDLARRLRERFFPHAPKVVLRSLVGVDSPYAWALRERAAPLTKEALDSVDRMDHPRAWALRRGFADRWPATAISSLRHLVITESGRETVVRALAAAPDDIVVLRSAHASFARALARREAAPVPRLEETCSI